jgi:preprotein translocase subunit SecA
MRRALLEGQDQKERIQEIIGGILATFIDLRCPEKGHPSAWDWTAFETDILTQFGVKIRTEELKNLDRRQAEETIREQLLKKYQEKEAVIGAEHMREAECMIMLNIIDNQWKDHLLSMDHLKEGIGLRGYGQKDPLIEYKKESYVMFQDMMDRIEDETIRWLFFMHRADEGETTVIGDIPDVPHPELWADDVEEEEPATVSVAASGPTDAQRLAAQNSVADLTRTITRKKEKELAALQFVGGESSTQKQPVLAGKTVGRNEPCPCGSGKKYKKCCGA